MRSFSSVPLWKYHSLALNSKGVYALNASLAEPIVIPVAYAPLLQTLRFLFVPALTSNNVAGLASPIPTLPTSNIENRVAVVLLT